MNDHTFIICTACNARVKERNKERHVSRCKGGKPGFKPAPGTVWFGIGWGIWIIGLVTTLVTLVLILINAQNFDGDHAKVFWAGLAVTLSPLVLFPLWEFIMVLSQHWSIPLFGSLAVGMGAAVWKLGTPSNIWWPRPSQVELGWLVVGAGVIGGVTLIILCIAVEMRQEKTRNYDSFQSMALCFSGLGAILTSLVLAGRYAWLWITG